MLLPPGARPSPGRCVGAPVPASARSRPRRQRGCRSRRCRRRAAGMRRSSSTTGVPEAIAAARCEVSEPSLGDTTKPSTRFSVSTRTAFCSTPRSSSVLTRTTSYPFEWATSDTPSQGAGEERVLDVGQDDAERLGGTGDHAARDAVGAVAEPVRRPPAPAHASTAAPSRSRRERARPSRSTPRPRQRPGGAWPSTAPVPPGARARPARVTTTSPRAGRWSEVGRSTAAPARWRSGPGSSAGRPRRGSAPPGGARRRRPSRRPAGPSR